MIRPDNAESTVVQVATSGVCDSKRGVIGARWEPRQQRV